MGADAAEARRERQRRRVVPRGVGGDAARRLAVAGTRVGIIVSGGNVDLDALPWAAAGGRS